MSFLSNVVIYAYDDENSTIKNISLNFNLFEWPTTYVQFNVGDIFELRVQIPSKPKLVV